jgi:hypothetical protein
MGPVSRPLRVWDNSAAARQFLHGTAGEVGEGRGAEALSPAIKELRSHCLRHKQVWDFRPTAYGISKCGIARSRQPSGAHTSAVRVPPPSATGVRARRRRPSNITADAGRVMSFTAPAAVRVRGNRPCHRLIFSSRGGRPTTGSGNSISARAVRFGRCVTDRLLPRACPVC